MDPILSSKIEHLIDEYKQTFCGINWDWRKGQKEIIIQIINAYFDNDINNVVAECPTGSGKSHIAMCVAWVLNNLKCRGYILASDISLQDQYEADIDKMNIKWPSVKGIDRYKCIENDECVSLGKCKILHKRPVKMPCYDQCPYYRVRDAASKSKTAVFNYSYWLLQMNYVRHMSDDPMFTTRDFIICDEAHKITDIVQSHFAPRINKLVILDNLKKLKIFLNNHIRTFKFDEKLILIAKITNKLIIEQDKEKTFKLLYHFANELKIIQNIKELIEDFVDETYNKLKISVPRVIDKACRNCDYLKDLYCKCVDFVTIISESGLDNLIINNIDKDQLVYNCLEEKYLMRKYFHDNKKFAVFLSATIGDINQFCNDTGIDKSFYYRMSSNFDFTKSPIYYYGGRRMSYSNMDDNMPWLIDSINKILEQYPDERGIIHSASYDLTMKIHEGLSEKNKDRLIVYKGSEEKQQGIDEMYKKGNKVLIGPSLIEGVNLPEDKCRFIVIAKIPYLSLNDKFVKAKLNKNTNWYKSKAVISILQGIGRGVRNENDYCDTFILDANFSDLLKNPNAFPLEFCERIIRK
ncbi:MAG: helicase C-terminal domain-containing protein [Clostridia bacterium]